MSLPIVWTVTAKDDYSDLLKYIEKEYGLNAALKFLEKAEEVVDTIEKFPNAFPVFEHDSKYRVAVVTKQTSLVYLVTETDSRMMYFWDNRMSKD